MSDNTMWQLAHMADCGEPDNDTSPGALFLRNVESATREAIEYEWTEDSANEIADGAPSAYTYQRWLEFVDLAAWQEDVAEILSGSDGDMSSMAGIALYMIAERLAQALYDEHLESTEEDDDDTF